MPEPGLYFTKGPDGLEIEELRDDCDGGANWFVFGSERRYSKPEGEIVSGPHTAEELQQAIKASEDG